MSNKQMQQSAAVRKGKTLQAYPKFAGCVLPDGTACAGVGRVEVTNGKPTFRCGQREGAPTVTPPMSKACERQKAV